MKKLLAITLLGALLLTACTAPDQAEAAGDRETTATTAVNETADTTEHTLSETTEEITTAEVTEEVTTEAATEEVTTEAITEEVTTTDPKEEAYNREDAFGFAYEGTEGDVARNRRIHVDVALTNQMDCEYEGSGSSGNFHAHVYLVSAAEPTYEIQPDDIPSTDEYGGHYKVAAGETHSFTFYFRIPTDAPAGAYNLVCQFRHSERTFESIFELE